MSAGNSSIPFNPLPAPFDGVDVSGKSVLTPGEIAAVSRNITLAMMSPMNTQMSYIMAGFRRMFGDGPESGLPEELRSKGLLCELKEAHDEAVNEQREWRTAQAAKEAQWAIDDAAKVEARLAFDTLLVNNQTDILARVVKLEKDKHKVRRNVVVFLRWFKRWLMTKDDGLTVAIGKVLVVLSLLGTSALASYHGLVFLGKQFVRLAHFILGKV